MISFGIFLKENRSETHMTKILILTFLLCDLSKSLYSEFQFVLLESEVIGLDNLPGLYFLKQKSGYIIYLRLYDNLLIYLYKSLI